MGDIPHRWEKSSAVKLYSRTNDYCNTNKLDDFPQGCSFTLTEKFRPSPFRDHRDPRSFMSIAIFDFVLGLHVCIFGFRFYLRIG